MGSIWRDYRGDFVGDALFQNKGAEIFGIFRYADSFSSFGAGIWKDRVFPGRMLFWKGDG